MTSLLPLDDDQAWQSWAAKWSLRAGTTYLNHGSFGPPPEPVRAARRRWHEQLDEQPMDFLARRLEPELDAALECLARFVGAEPDNMIFVDNATYAMNVVAESFSLAAGDQVLLTNHEYGAVKRIWDRACGRVGAEVCVADLTEPIESVEQVVEAIFASVTERTRLLVVSHITSPTAIILPVEAICRRARAAEIAVCVDGPHAIAHLPLAIEALDCDYYTASCHKWLSAPIGSGFLYVHPRRQGRVVPPILSWGRWPQKPTGWREEFAWIGTRDVASFLTVPTAIEFLEGVGLDLFRRRTHFLARYARQRLVDSVGLSPLVPDSPEWYGSMAHVPLPPGEARPLQDRLWQQHGIETPIVEFGGRRWIRVSCHLYNTQAHVDRLVEALEGILAPN